MNGNLKKMREKRNETIAAMEAVVNAPRRKSAA